MKNSAVDFDSAAKGNNDTFKKFFHGMLNRGIYIAPSAFETWFITDALTYQDLNETITAVDEIAKEDIILDNKKRIKRGQSFYTRMYPLCGNKL